MRIRELNTGLQQVIEATCAETIRIPLNKIASKTIHGDLQHEPDIVTCRRIFRRAGRRGSKTHNN